MTSKRLKSEKRQALFALEGQNAKASITQKPKATRVALSDALYDVIGIEDIVSMIFSYVTPICATLDDLAKIGIESVQSRSAAMAIKADATVHTVGFYILGFRHTLVGNSKWPRFLMSQRSKGRNVLANIFCNCRSSVPLHLLQQIIPQNEDDREEYALQHTVTGACLMVLAGRRDAITESNWRLTAMWSLFPALCARMIQPPNQSEMPLFHVLGYYCLFLEKEAQLNFKVLSQVTLQLLPRDEDQVTNLANPRRFSVRENGRNLSLIVWLIAKYREFDSHTVAEIKRKLQRMFDFH